MDVATKAMLRWGHDGEISTVTVAQVVHFVKLAWMDFNALQAH
jgi:hypothetical protein